MPDPPTPGQLAYAAYWPGLTQHRPYLRSDPPVEWDALPTPVQAAWEAAAQAVLAMQEKETRNLLPAEAGSLPEDFYDQRTRRAPAVLDPNNPQIRGVV